MATFEIGKKYFTTSACDHNCVFVVEIVKRTAKTVTFRRDGQERRAKIYTDHDGEYIIPERYSMAPVFRASSEYLEAEEGEEIKDPVSAFIPQAVQPADHPGLVMVGQPVAGNWGAMYPLEAGVIVGFAEREATRWTPGAGGRTAAPPWRPWRTFTPPVGGPPPAAPWACSLPDNEPPAPERHRGFLFTLFCFRSSW